MKHKPLIEKIRYIYLRTIKNVTIHNLWTKNILSLPKKNMIVKTQTNHILVPGFWFWMIELIEKISMFYKKNRV